MNGIDVASWQAGIRVDRVPSDFVIAKATEGTDYVNPECDNDYHEARIAGKALGVYHFARPSRNTARSEAEFFARNTEGYLGEAIFALDWEDPGTQHMTGWANEFMDHFHALTGINPMIYMSESVVTSYDWSRAVDNDRGLWVAKYRDMVDDWNYDMSQAGSAPSGGQWGGYAIWQWTSCGRLENWGGRLDCNKFYGDRAAWAKYAGGAGTAPQPNPSPGPAPAPVNTYTVQPGDTLSAIAARFNTTWQHLQAINGLRDANLIFPGQVLKVTGEAQTRTYTVQPGDTLSAIGSRFGVDYKAIAAANGISNPNLIFPGQVLRIP